MLLASCERLFSNEIEQHAFEDQMRAVFGTKVCFKFSALGGRGGRKGLTRVYRMRIKSLPSTRSLESLSSKWVLFSFYMSLFVCLMFYISRFKL